MKLTETQTINFEIPSDCTIDKTLIECGVIKVVKKEVESEDFAIFKYYEYIGDKSRYLTPSKIYKSLLYPDKLEIKIQNDINKDTIIYRNDFKYLNRRTEQDYLNQLAAEKKKELPNSFDELVLNGEYYFIDFKSEIETYSPDGKCFKESDSNLCTTESTAEAFKYAIKLTLMRDVYNEGWRADWTDMNQEKFSIYRYGGNIAISRMYSISCLLSFKSRELAEKFLNNFLNEIELAKEVI